MCSIITDTAITNDNTKDIKATVSPNDEPMTSTATTNKEITFSSIKKKCIKELLLQTYLVKEGIVKTKKEMKLIEGAFQSKILKSHDVEMKEGRIVGIKQLETIHAIHNNHPYSSPVFAVKSKTPPRTIVELWEKKYKKSSNIML
jgi:hypothetical protein